MDYTNQQTLFNALDNGDCATVKRCLRAGQNLNQPDSIHSQPLLMWALASNNIPRVQTLLAFHKHLDLNHQNSGGGTALVYAALFNHQHAFHSLIQLGADINIKTNGGQNTYIIVGFSQVGKLSHEDRRKVKMMLLLAGVDPVRADHDDVIVNYARKWLSGLEYAKKRFQSIFDNEMLEKTVCEFIYNEEFLRKVL